jgi:hypothetical protein
MATNSVSARLPKPSSLAQGKCAIVSLARLAARNAVKEDLRSQGFRLSRVRARDIEERAQAYLKDHPDLFWAALDRACKIGLIDPVDRDRFLDLLEITRYFAPIAAVTKTDGLWKSPMLSMAGKFPEA